MSLNVAKDSLSELMSPGERISSVYNSEENCHVFKDKTTFTNRFVYNLTNLQMNGQQIQINIPNDGLFNYLYLALSFPTVASTTGVSAGLVPLAAYSILQQIQYQLFGSTIYQIDGIQAMHSVFSDCQTKEQMDELILLGGGAGAAIFNGTGSTMGQGVASVTYYCAIPLPWNRIYNNLKETKALVDMGMSQQPMTLRLSFRGAQSVYYASAGAPSFPSAFTNAYIQTRIGYFYDRNDHLKLKESVVEDGKVIEKTNVYSIPIRYEYSTITQIFNGSLNGTPLATTILTGFMSGNLAQIRLALYDVNSNGTSPIQVPAVGTTSSTPINYLACETPQNFSLLFNGVPIFVSNQDAFRIDSVYMFQVPRKASLAPSGSPSYYWMEIPISRFLSESIEDCFTYGTNLSSQTLTIQLNTATTDPYQFYVTYVYASTLGFDGSTAVYFF